MVFTLPTPAPLAAVVPPAKVPLVLLLLPEIFLLPSVRSPKSCPLPSDAIVTKSILVTHNGPEGAFPPANIPRVELETLS